MFKFNNKTISLALMGGFLFLSLVNLYLSSETTERQTQRVDYTQFVKDVQEKRVKSVHIQGENIRGHYVDGQEFHTHAPFQDRDCITRLLQHNVTIRSYPIEAPTPSLAQIFIAWAPMLFLVGIWIFFFRQMHQSGGKGFGLKKSQTEFSEQKSVHSFQDIAGIDEAKHELQEVVDFLKESAKFQTLGAHIPKGVLLIGPPGTGKTLLVKAVAGEANVPFISISGSEFVEMFVGIGASRVRDLFRNANQLAEKSEGKSCIIFIDEIDSVGRHRGGGMGGGNDEREQTLNQLLVEMDGMKQSDYTIVVLASTNRPDVLDKALLRPGRFDRHVSIDYPDLEGRHKILQVHTKNVPLDEDTDLKVIARGTPGFSGADLANVVNEGALYAGRLNCKKVTQAHLEFAKDKVMMGAERVSLRMTEEEKKITAYHEAGHALVAYHSVYSDPIHKATIMPRGQALGMVIRLPERDRISVSYNKLMADLAVAMGGRLAEELTLGHASVTTGASSDFKMATDIARRMVTEWGMSENLGLISYASNPHEPSFTSENTATLIHQEVKKIIDHACKNARDILSQYKSQLTVLAQELLNKETLSGQEITRILTQDISDSLSEECTIHSQDVEEKT